MFPAFKSGNINTLAIPATFDPGAFFTPTFETIAASNCISPSKSKFTFLVFRISTACCTLDTIGCSALPIVENESNATLGSVIPAVNLAFSAADIAISAICSAVGSGITPPSENTNTPLSPYSGVFVIIINELETVFSPGFTPITCIAALSTLAVGEFDPATIPSANPILTNIAPKNLESVSMISLASSIVIPFFSLNFCNSTANSSVLAYV